jgi:hypothetical protein
MFLALKFTYVIYTSIQKEDRLCLKRGQANIPYSILKDCTFWLRKAKLQFEHTEIMGSLLVNRAF